MEAKTNFFLNPYGLQTVRITRATYIPSGYGYYYIYIDLNYKGSPARFVASFSDYAKFKKATAQGRLIDVNLALFWLIRDKIRPKIEKWLSDIIIRENRR